jgi:hypothetical protein
MTLPSSVGRDSLRGLKLIETLTLRGWRCLIRSTFVESREVSLARHPNGSDDFIDEVEFHEWEPDLILIEGGLHHHGTDSLKLPAILATDFVERGGSLVVLDNDLNAFSGREPLGRDLPFFGADLGPRRHVPYLEDQVSFDGSFRTLVCRPERQAISEWLLPAFDGVASIAAVHPVPLAVLGDIVASAEPTARALELDVYSSSGPYPHPFATVRQHGRGFACLVAATVSPDDLTDRHPGNVEWIANLGELLATAAARNRRIRNPKESSPAWIGDDRRTEDLVEAPEGVTLEVKETVRLNVRTGERDNAMSDEVVQAIQELWNTDGGVVLVGVQDSPRVVTGVERDFAHVRPPNSDGLVLFIAERVSQLLGSIVAVQLLVRAEQVGEFEVIRVDVPRGAVPAWMNNRRFRVRRQNGGIDLEGPDIQQYIRERFS